MIHPCVVCKRNKGVYKLNGLRYCASCLDRVKVEINNETQHKISSFL